MTIVLAKVEMTAIRATGRTRFDGANYFPVFEPAPEAKACVWLNKAKQSDIAKAETFAKTEGYTVFTYSNERDPLGRAKKDVMKAFNNEK
jgi:hypothetical protein